MDRQPDGGEGSFREIVETLQVPGKTDVGSGQHPKAKNEQELGKLHLLA